MSDTARQEQRDAAREAERIRSLLRRHGGRDYDPSREEEDYEGGFHVEVGKSGGPHHVGGFHIDPFRVWPPKMHQHCQRPVKNPQWRPDNSPLTARYFSPTAAV